MMKRGYFGDTSALCHLPACADGPAGVVAGAQRVCQARRPQTDLLRPGCGPDLLWFALPGGELRCTAQLFEGARVHGLRAAGDRCLVAYGGRRVATFHIARGGAGSGAVRPAAALPALAAWVMDVKPLRRDDEPPEAAPTLLAGARPAALMTCASAVRSLRARRQSR